MRKKISTYNKKKMVGIEHFLRGKQRIFDVGTGAFGSDWWKKVDDGAQITGIELQFFPKKLPKNVCVYKLDAGQLGSLHENNSIERLWHFGRFIKEKVSWKNQFDFVVANHVLEHVANFSSTVKGISQLLRKGGVMYAGFPDSRNFTDVFYHLIHPNGGGHIQMLTDEIVKRECEKNGLRCISQGVWPDDWLWFEKLYNWKTYMWPENKHLCSEKISYLANTFRKELTAKKGYFYGWEMVFEKVK